MNDSLKDDGLYDSSSAEEAKESQRIRHSDRPSHPFKLEEVRGWKSKKCRRTGSTQQHLGPLPPLPPQKLPKLDTRQQRTDVLLKLAPQEVITPYKPLSERTRGVGRVVGTVDEGDEFVHPFAVGGGEGDEGGEFRVEDFEGGGVNLYAGKVGLISFCPCVKGMTAERREPGTHINDHVNMTISLLLEDAVRRADEERPSLQQVDLL
jgi:hypothetical protein